MGIEWNLGCTRSKHHIWLGSQKPYKWRGFQLPLDNLRRFVALHPSDGVTGNPMTSARQANGGNLLLANDYTLEVPWEDDETTWREDLLSRSFCWDSWDYHKQQMSCAQSQKVLPSTEEARLAAGHLKKGEELWFYSQADFEEWVAFQETERWTLIHDSTDQVVEMGPSVLEMGCTVCKEYYCMETAEDAEALTPLVLSHH